MQTEQKKLTGYPSIDKPWLKYYSEQDLQYEVPQCSMYDYMHDHNIGYEDEIAIEYFGRKISFKELFHNINIVSKAFTSMGIKCGDNVAICSITTPEIIYSLYALNRLGVTVNMLEPRNNAERIAHYIRESGSEYVIMLDICFGKFQEILKTEKIKKIIVVGTTMSAPILTKIGYIFANKNKQKILYEGVYEKWTSFVSRGKNGNDITDAPYDEKRTAVIVYTGGTTGIPKGAMLSDSNLNHIAQLLWTSKGIGQERQDKYLMIMPPFIAYGLCGMHAPLSFGKRMIVIPNFKQENFARLILKHKPNYAVGVPAYFETLASYKDKKVDLSYIKGLIAGGDKLTSEIECKVMIF